MSNISWQLLLANSSDLSVICPLQKASGISVEATLNRPGRLTFTYPLGDALAAEISPVSRCVLLVHDGVILWSGPIGPIQESLPEEKMSVVATGWLELLYKRILRAKTTYTSQTRGSIIHSLLTTANAQRTTWMSVGTDEDSAPVISKTFDIFSNIGQGIEEMTSLEASPDIFVDPETRELNVRNYLGYDDHPEVVWAYGWGPSNLESFTRQIDSDAMVNRINVIGKNSNTTAYIAADTTSQSLYSLYETEVTLSSVIDQEVIAAYAEAEIVYRGNPRVTYSFQPRAGEDMPCIWLDFELGDRARLKAVSPPRINVQQNVRIFSVTLQIDDNGNHKLTNVTTVAA